MYSDPSEWQRPSTRPNSVGTAKSISISISLVRPCHRVAVAVAAVLLLELPLPEIVPLIALNMRQVAASLVASPRSCFLLDFSGCERRIS